MTEPTPTTTPTSNGPRPGKNKANTETNTPENKRGTHRVTPAKPDTNKQETPYESQIFTIPEAAGQLQVSTYTLQDMLRRGELKGSKIRSRWRISGAQIQEFVKKNQAK